MNHICLRISAGLLLLVMIGCNLTGGAGSIVWYDFQVSKADLAKAIHTVLDTGKFVYRDPLREDVMTVDGVVQRKVAYYNDSVNYLRIKIIDDTSRFEYTFRYYGDSTSSQAGISVAYAWDQYGHGGAKGMGNWDKTDPALRARIINAFELKFVKKVQAIIDK